MNEQFIYQIIFGVIILFAIGYIVFIDIRKNNPWKFSDMFITHRNGHPVADRQAFMLICGWFVLTSWGTYLIVAKEMQEWFAVLYAAYCGGSYGYSRYLKSKFSKEDK